MKRAWRRARAAGSLLCLLALPVGCDGEGPGESTGETDTGESTGANTSTTTTTTTTTTTGEGLACYHFEAGTDTNPPPPLECEYTQPCETIEWAPDGCGADPVAYDPTAGECLIASLKSGAQAVHQIDWCPGAPIDDRQLDLTALGDGTVVWAEFHNTAGDAYFRTTWRALPPPSYFDGCDVQTYDALMTCLKGILEQDCQLGEPACA